MNNVIKEVASILMYKGPTMNELIEQIAREGNKFNIVTEGSTIIIDATSIQPYNLLIRDKYYYNSDEELIRHILVLDNKETVLFDKFNEAKALIDSLEIKEAI